MIHHRVRALSMCKVSLPATVPLVSLFIDTSDVRRLGANHSEERRNALPGVQDPDPLLRQPCKASTDERARDCTPGRADAPCPYPRAHRAHERYHRGTSSSPEARTGAPGRRTSPSHSAAPPVDHHPRAGRFAACPRDPRAVTCAAAELNRAGRPGPRRPAPWHTSHRYCVDRGPRSSVRSRSRWATTEYPSPVRRPRLLRRFDSCHPLSRGWRPGWLGHPLPP